MIVLLRLAAVLIFLTGVSHEVVAERLTEWPALRDTNLLVQEGSVLDFSGFQQLRPIEDKDRIFVDADGHFRRINDGASMRFFIAALGFNIITNGFPSTEEAPVWVSQVVRRGYNAVRFDFVEAVLMNRRSQDFDYDKEQLKRFHFLLAELRRSGVYYVINLMSSGNGAYGSVQERWRDQKNLMARMYFDESAVEHWKKIVKTLYLQKNPYTGQSILSDPALAGVAMVNESGLSFVTRRGIPPEIDRDWRSWLASRQGRTDHAGPWSPFRRRDAAWQAFVVDSEHQLALKKIQFLRNLGFDGPVTGYNNWLSPAASVSRSNLPWIDMHNYAAEPDRWIAAGSRLKSVDLIGGRAAYLRDLALTKVWGRPFTITEYGQVFWDQRRFVNALVAPSIAAHQSWQGLCQHSRAVELSMTSQGGLRQLSPFMVGMDPISRAGEVISAAAYGRRDVSEGKSKIIFDVDSKLAIEDTDPLSTFDRNLSQLALVTRVGLVTDEVRKKHVRGLSDFIVPINGFERRKRMTLGEVITTLKAKDLLPLSNKTDPGAGVFESDTSELELNAEQGVYTVRTDRMEGIAFSRSRSERLPVLSIKQTTAPATTALISVDGRSLSTSQRMLFVLATDARNTGMIFRDEGEEIIEYIGRWPLRIRPIKIHVGFSVSGDGWHFYPVAMSGARHSPIPLMKTKEGFFAVIDTSNLADGPVVFFELVRLNKFKQNE